MEEIRRPISVFLLVLSGLVAVLGSLGFARFGYSMILPGMKDSLVLTYAQTGLMASGNFLGYVIFAVLGGLLSAKYGPRRVIVLSLALVGVTMSLTGFVEDFSQALVLRSLTGIGSGGANVSAIMLPTAWIKAKRRGLASGTIASGSGIGLIATGIVVPKMNELFGAEGWRYSWLFLGVLTFLFAFFCGLTVRNPPEKVLGESARSLAYRVVAKDTVLWKMGLIYFMFGLSYVIYITFFGAYLVKEVGLTTQSAGVLWALVGGLSIFSGPLWGYISDGIGRAYAIALVYFVQSVSFFLFCQIGMLSALYVSVVLFGLTAWSIPSIIAAYAGDHFGPQSAFSALGFLTLFFGIGQVVGPSIAGYVADLTKTFVTAFLLSSATAAFGGLLSLRVMRAS